jgi:hypothetical protein
MGTARLAVQRLRTLQEKKEAQAKVARRDIATLLEPQRNKIETARLKVESSALLWCLYSPAVETRASNQRGYLPRAP